MDPKAAIEAIQRGHLAAEHARAYNAWRAGQGFAAEAFLPDAYDLGAPNGPVTFLCDIARVYRGHRCWRARVELRGGQGSRCVDLSDLHVVP